MSTQVAIGGSNDHANRSEYSEKLSPHQHGKGEMLSAIGTYKRRHDHVLIPPVACSLQVSGIEAECNSDYGQHGEDDRHGVHLPWSLNHCHPERGKSEAL
jgi:hypothetical protein